MVGSVCVGRLAGHEVDESLEGDGAYPVGIHYAHDAGELVVTLVATERICEARSPWRLSPQQHTYKKNHSKTLILCMRRYKCVQFTLFIVEYCAKDLAH